MNPAFPPIRLWFFRGHLPRPHPFFTIAREQDQWMGALFCDAKAALASGGVVSDRPFFGTRPGTGPGTVSGAQISRRQAGEEKAAKYMESVRHQPGLLLAFLQQMPKGGDLHVHLSGAIYAESFIDWASENALCVDRSTSKLMHAACDSCEPYNNKPSVRCAYQDHILYDQLVDAWSMRNWHREEESGHDHFFATFEKFGPAMEKHIGDALAEVAARAATDHLQYVEVMHTADGAQAAILGTKVGWDVGPDNDFGKLREKLLAGGMADVVSSVRSALDSDEARKKEVLHCGTAQAAPGCAVTIHYLYQVLRGLPREQVFAQILLGFELVKADPRFVGFNLVMPEDYYVPMHDFDLHMRMIEALRKFYPATHVSLHAGRTGDGAGSTGRLALPHSRID